jgi:hypothetical protein
MEPTRSKPMLSLHVCEDPRRLTVAEEARIARVLAAYPPVYLRRVKLAAVPERKVPAAQPWELLRSAA